MNVEISKLSMKWIYIQMGTPCSGLVIATCEIFILYFVVKWAHLILSAHLAHLLKATAICTAILTKKENTLEHRKRKREKRPLFPTAISHTFNCNFSLGAETNYLLIFDILFIIELNSNGLHQPFLDSVAFRCIGVALEIRCWCRRSWRRPQIRNMRLMFAFCILSIATCNSAVRSSNLY